jgi:signal peptidase I
VGSTKPWQILRKAPDKQSELQMVVYDDDHPPHELLATGWPERWQAEDGSGWTRPKDGQRSLRVDAPPTTPTDWHWVRYWHYVPDTEAWEAVRRKAKIVSSPLPLLITDFCGYNARVTVDQALHAAEGRGKRPSEADPFPPLPGRENATGVLWAGDLTLHSDVEVLSTSGDVMWELVEGSRSYRAKLDVATGNVTFSYLLHDSDGSEPEEVPIGQRAYGLPLKGPGTYRAVFANVDDRLCFWVNDRLVTTFEFNPEARDGRLSAPRPVRPTERDLAPAGIAARGASAIVRHLKLERDVYYRGVEGGDMDPSHNVDESLSRNPGLLPNVSNLLPYRSPDDLAALQDRPLSAARQFEFSVRATLADPERWNKQFSSYLNDVVREFPLTDSEDDALDEFMVLGDNSPRSSDSRFWGAVGGAPHAHAVPRKLLIGKAFFIYWPHAVPFLNDGKGYAIRHWPQPDEKQWQGPLPEPIPSLSVPWYPQFGRMTRIR